MVMFFHVSIWCLFFFIGLQPLLCQFCFGLSKNMCLSMFKLLFCFLPTFPSFFDICFFYFFLKMPRDIKGTWGDHRFCCKGFAIV